jgi:hypothetical protein
VGAFVGALDRLLDLGDLPLEMVVVTAPSGRSSDESVGTSSSAAPPSHCSATTVVLSAVRPFASTARRTSSGTCCATGACANAVASVPSGTPDQKPSEHSTSTSPRCSRAREVISTVGSNGEPRQFSTLLRSGWVSCSCAPIRPNETIVCTFEWSRVRDSTRPSRSQ